MGKLDKLEEGALDDINWPKGIALLSDKGRQQCKQKGRNFADKLLNDYKVFNTKVLYDKIEIIASDKKRVSDSAMLFVQSMIDYYNEKGFDAKNFNLKQIKYLDRNRSYFLGDQIKKNCPMYKKFKDYNKKYYSYELQDLSLKYTECLNNTNYKLEHTLKPSFSIEFCDKIYDDMLVYKYHDKFHNKYPIDCMPIYEKCNNLFWSGIKYGPRAADLYVSPSIDKIKLNLDDNKHKVHLYFTNDHTIMPIAIYFGMNLAGLKPRFADSFTIIIMKRADGVKFVKLIYQNRNLMVLKYEYFEYLLDRNDYNYKNLCSNYNITDKPYILRNLN